MKIIPRFAIFFPLVALSLSSAHARSSESTLSKETLVFLRHAEKPKDEIGQLNCQGLSRSLKIPGVLIEKFGKPDFIFAPNPNAKKRNKRTEEKFYYIRPLATIEPLAIRLEMPIDLGIGYDEVENAVGEWMGKQYSGSLLFISWEHRLEEQIIRSIYTSVEGNKGSDIPKWEDADFDSLYVLTIYRDAEKKITRIEFKKDEQGLNAELSEHCPQG